MYHRYIIDPNSKHHNLSEYGFQQNGMHSRILFSLASVYQAYQRKLPQ